MTLRDGTQGRFGEPMVSWVRRDSDRRSVLVHIDGRVSLAELLSFVEDAGISPADILINGSLRWERDATPEECAERAVWEEKAAARHQQWERRFFAQMLEQYGPEGPPPPDPPDGEITLLVSPPNTDGAGRRMPGAQWVVSATHQLTGLSATGYGEYKLPATERAIRAVRELVSAEPES